MTQPPDIIALLYEDAWARRLARALTRDPHRADDLVQEAYVRAASRAARETALGGESRATRQPRAWFARVLSNLAREAHRRDRARTERERARSGLGGEASATHSREERGDLTAHARLFTHATPAELAARAEVQERLAHEVLALTDTLREVVLLHHFEGLGPTDIATSLGVPRSTMQDRLTRAHATLRVRLADLEREPRSARGLALLLVPVGLPARTALTPTLLTYMSSKHVLIAGALLLSVVVAVVRASSLFESATAPSSAEENTMASEPLPAASERAPGELASVLATERSDATVATATHENALATVHARVIDEVGAPVAGAFVQLIQTDEERRASTVELEPGVSVIMGPRGTTDAEGRTSLQVPTGRSLEFTAERPRRRSSLGRATLGALEPGAAAELELRVRVTPDLDLELRFVAEEDGAPVAGLEIRKDGQALGRNPVVLPRGITHTSDAITDGTGNATLRAASWRDEGALLLGADRAPCIVTLRNAGPRNVQEEPVTIAVPRAARIEGVVQRAPVGARARVRFNASRLVPNAGSNDRFPDGSGTREFVIEAPLDSSGQFVLAGLPPRVALTPELLAADGATTLYVAPTPLTLAPGEAHA
jgi:RNA polymerase sigma-70 factor (ECF subfamily)